MERRSWQARRAICVLVLAAGLAACASVQDGSRDGFVAGSATIHGQLETEPADAATRNSAVAGVEVAVAGTRLSTTTANDGRFTLEGVPSGEVELVFRAPEQEVRLVLGGLTERQTIRLRVRLSGGHASVGAISRSIDDVQLDLDPEVWQLRWATMPTEDDQPGIDAQAAADLHAGGVLATITGTPPLLDRLDDECFDLRHERRDGTVHTLLPESIERHVDTMALRFDRRAALELIEDPGDGDEFEVAVVFCLETSDGPHGGDTPGFDPASLYEVRATVTIAEEPTADTPPQPDADPGFAARFEPGELELHTQPDGTNPMVVDSEGDEALNGSTITIRVRSLGAPNDVTRIDVASLRLGHGRNEADLSDRAELDEEADPAEIVARLDADAAIGLIDEVSVGSFEFWLGFDLANGATDAVTASAAGGARYDVELTLELTLVEPREVTGEPDLPESEADRDRDAKPDADPETEPEPDGEPLVAVFQPDVWNTNWSREDSGWVTLKIRGDGFERIPLDAIRISVAHDDDATADEPEAGAQVAAPVPEPEEALGDANGGMVAPVRVQRQGNHVRAFFDQRDAIGLITDPVPGQHYVVCIHIGAADAGNADDIAGVDDTVSGGCSLRTSVRVSGPPVAVPRPVPPA